MNQPGFFDRQATAKRNTGLLVGLFSLAVLIIALAVCLVGYLTTSSETTSQPFHQWLWGSHGLITAGAVIALIVGASAMRWFDLASGGDRVAQMVRARQLDPSSQDMDERRLRNIVEEMAIASGVPVPQLYVMDQETGINAFVAGYSANEAVMVVTHGALTQLSRDELQGVVGHEFSHILNGDMRLNVRLIALLAGILAIGQIGFFLLRGSGSHGHIGGSAGRNNNRGVLVVVGLALAAIGYIGVFFGRLIQAAVSRERERLADASSVQFTRNPEGIGSALFKIGQMSGYLESTHHASDMNHMCFGESTRMAFSRLLGSHPPIEERIEALQPGLLARLRSRTRDLPPQNLTEPSIPVSAVPFATTNGQRNQTPASVSRQAGTVSAGSEDYAVTLLARLPATVKNLLYTRSGAVQLIYALLTRDLPTEQLAKYLNHDKPAAVLTPVIDLIMRIRPTLAQEGDGIRLPALELAMPALRQLGPDERQQLIDQVRTLIRADERVDIFELALYSFLQRHLGVGAGRNVAVRYRRYSKVQADLINLFSVMARAGTRDAREARLLLQDVMASFYAPANASPPDLVAKVSVSELGASLKRLNQLSPLLKPAILDACAQCVSHDQKVEPREYELLRLIADQLDVPLPPLPTSV